MKTKWKSEGRIPERKSNKSVKNEGRSTETHGVHGVTWGLALRDPRGPKHMFNKGCVHRCVSTAVLARQPKEEWISKCGPSYSGMAFGHKRGEVLAQATTWKDLENMLCNGNQTWKKVVVKAQGGGWEMRANGYGVSSGSHKISYY